MAPFTIGITETAQIGKTVIMAVRAIIPARKEETGMMVAAIRAAGTIGIGTEVINVMNVRGAGTIAVG